MFALRNQDYSEGWSYSTFETTCLWYLETQIDSDYWLDFFFRFEENRLFTLSARIRARACKQYCKTDFCRVSGATPTLNVNDWRRIDPAIQKAQGGELVVTNVLEYLTPGSKELTRISIKQEDEYHRGTRDLEKHTRSYRRNQIMCFSLRIDKFNEVIGQILILSWLEVLQQLAFRTLIYRGTTTSK